MKTTEKSLEVMERLARSVETNSKATYELTKTIKKIVETTKGENN